MHVNKLIFSLLRKIDMYVYEINQPDLTAHIYTTDTLPLINVTFSRLYSR